MSGKDGATMIDRCRRRRWCNTMIRVVAVVNRGAAKTKHSVIISSTAAGGCGSMASTIKCSLRLALTFLAGGIVDCVVDSSSSDNTIIMMETRNRTSGWLNCSHRACSFYTRKGPKLFVNEVQEAESDGKQAGVCVFQHCFSVTSIFTHPSYYVDKGVRDTVELQRGTYNVHRVDPFNCLQHDG